MWCIMGSRDPWKLPLFYKGIEWCGGSEYGRLREVKRPSDKASTWMGARDQRSVPSHYTCHGLSSLDSENFSNGSPSSFGRYVKSSSPHLVLYARGSRRHHPGGKDVTCVWTLTLG